MGRKIKGGHLRPLSKSAQMKAIARGLRRLKPGVGLMKLLTEDPAAARELGLVTERFRTNFNAAYPGETRTEKFSATDWKNAGHDEVAEVTRLMGLDGY